VGEADLWGRRRYADRMDYVSYLERRSFDRPPLVCAFSGWNDGGESASTAARYLAEHWGARTFAHLDPEEFFDFQVTRPMVRLVDGVSRVIEWPRGEFAGASVGGKDVVVFTAAEPNVRWRTFAGAIVDLAADLGSGLIVTLGAFLADVPHSREVPVVGSAADLDTAERLGLARSRYEGPTGIVGVLHDAANRRGILSVSLWAAVPHYLPAAPNPKAALALVRRTTSLLGIPVDTGDLAVAASGWERGVARLLEESAELSEYVERLESASDDDEEEEDDAIEEGSVPSGDAIAAELERYLREQSGDGSAG
jgi:predicted ATP-grasp superfamily ATP-dependent carboligase